MCSLWLFATYSREVTCKNLGRIETYKTVCYQWVTCKEFTFSNKMV